MDANNLYEWSMMQKLPYKNFQWFTEPELNGFNEGGQSAIMEYLNQLYSKDMGCFMEVKILYPKG